MHSTFVGLAWLVIPHEGLGFYSTNFTFNSWRIFLALCVLPAFTSAIMFAVMPESPKYLMMVSTTERRESKVLDDVKYYREERVQST